MMNRVKTSFYRLFLGECGGKYNQNKGYITSPGFPEKYPNGKECMHSISVPDDKVVKLAFNRLVRFNIKSLSRLTDCEKFFSLRQIEVFNIRLRFKHILI